MISSNILITCMLRFRSKAKIRLDAAQDTGGFALPLVESGRVPARVIQVQTFAYHRHDRLRLNERELLPVERHLEEVGAILCEHECHCRAARDLVRELVEGVRKGAPGGEVLQVEAVCGLDSLLDGLHEREKDSSLIYHGHGHRYHGRATNS